ncbi:MAG: decarboxylase [Chitinophagaceae bacterium]|nr:MAG: decarboxylase [Chitinophagaceae bacterium]
MKYDSIEKLESKYGNSFYVLNISSFENNVKDLLQAFRKYYSFTNIGYSYKTNYIPYLCKKADGLNAYAEIVSELELRIAQSINVNPQKIIYNGPEKSVESLEFCLINGSKVNVDNNYELGNIVKIANKHANRNFEIGIRFNIDLKDNFFSRFGYDVNSENFRNALNIINSTKNLNISGVHFHSGRPDRSIASYLNRLNNLIAIAKNELGSYDIKYINIGGGFYGRMDENMKSQFDGIITSFEEYGQAIATRMREEFPKGDIELILEPGVALTVDVLHYIAKIYDVRNIQAKNIAICSGSFFNVKPSGHSKNLTVRVIKKNNNNPVDNIYQVVGYTCLENDILCENFTGTLEAGDYLKFKNVGAYTIVFTPPFIKLAPPIIAFDNGEEIVVRQKETFEDIFRSYFTNH